MNTAIYCTIAIGEIQYCYINLLTHLCNLFTLMYYFLSHIIQTPSVFGKGTFPGLVNTIATAKDDDTGEGWDDVRRHLSVVIFTIRSAASTLNSVTDFIISTA